MTDSSEDLKNAMDLVIKNISEISDDEVERFLRAVGPREDRLKLREILRCCEYGEDCTMGWEQLKYLIDVHNEACWDTVSFVDSRLVELLSSLNLVVDCGKCIYIKGVRLSKEALEHFKRESKC